MLWKLTKKCFSSKILSWGPNLKTLGYMRNTEDKLDLPKKLDIAFQGNIHKAINGYSDNLVLVDNGEIYHQGTAHLFKKNAFFDKIDIKEFEQSIVDADCDQTKLIFLNKEGRVFEVDKEKLIKEVKLPTPARFVASGTFASFAVLRSENGLDAVWAWGECESWDASSIFNRVGPFKTDPIELKEVSKLLQLKNSKIKKIKLVNNSAMLLLENGQLIAWGNNQKGNLGVPRPLLSRTDDYVIKPVEILTANHLKNKVIDFDMSDNVLIVLTEEGQALYSGLDNILTLKLIRFFEGCKIKSIGANFNHIYIQNASDDKWYSNKPFEGQTLLKFYGELELYQLEKKHFEGNQIQTISGKYSNAFAF